MYVAEIYPVSPARLATALLIWRTKGRSALSMQLVEDSDMRYVQMFSRFSLTIPVALRLWLVILCTIASQTLFILLAPIEQNPCILAIPIVLAAWYYRRRGLLLCLAALAITTWIFYVIHRWPHGLSYAFIISFATGVLALLATGLLVSWLRDASERVEESERRLARAYEEEQRLHQEKNLFMQHVNHELKTPLTSLGGCLELLLEQNNDFDAETRATFLQQALSSYEELQMLTSNVLESLQTQDEQETPPARATALASVVREVIHLADPRWQLEKRTRLDISEDLRALAYPQYLRQLLRNLLSNAVKYAPSEQPILINARRIKSSSTEKPEICVSVKDWGPGIPANEIHQLFGQFVRLRRDILGQVRGSGLGLAISKQLVEAMGGRIWVESSGVPGEGSCFSFTLPAVSPV